MFLRKQKFYEGIKSPILIRTSEANNIRSRLKTRQISQKILVTFLSDNETCLKIGINKPNCSTLKKFTVDYNSKPFWKGCKPYLSNKNSYIQENIMLLEKHKLLSKQKDVAAIFNKHFGSMTDSLNHFSWPEET